jgi:hypothetical protein
MHLMWSGRFGKSLLLMLTRISFWLSLSLDKTGQRLALANSCPGGIEMPKEVKKELCTSERVLFLLLPDAQSCVGVWVGEGGGAFPGKTNLGACFLLA